MVLLERRRLVSKIDMVFHQFWSKLYALEGGSGHLHLRKAYFELIGQLHLYLGCVAELKSSLDLSVPAQIDV